jgi:hypothetical protein
MNWPSLDLNGSVEQTVRFEQNESIAVERGDNPGKRLFAVARPSNHFHRTTIQAVLTLRLQRIRF